MKKYEEDILLLEDQNSKFHKVREKRRLSMSPSKLRGVFVCGCTVGF